MGKELPPYGVTTPRKDGSRLLAAFTVSKRQPFSVICSECKAVVFSGAYHECWSTPTQGAYP